MLKFSKISTVVLMTMVLLLAGAGFGCKGLSSEEQAAVQPVTLEYWTVFDDYDALQAQINKYRTLRPYLTVNLRQVGADELYNRLVEALSEDKGPDIISISNRAMQTYESKLASMPAAVPDATVTVTEGSFGKQTTVTPATVALPDALAVEREYVATVKKDVVIGGKVYGLPLSLDTMAIYYNKDLLDRSGVPTVPKTWEEFQEAVKKITKYDKQTNKITQSGAALGAGKNIPNADDIIYILYRQSGLDFVNKTGQAVFNAVPARRDEGETPAQQVVSFYTNFANPTRDTYCWNDDMENALDRFTKGSVGFFFGYNYQLATIKARAPELNLGIIPLLQLNPEQPVNAANYWVQAVVGKSKHQNEAWGLINYLARSANKEYLDASGSPTALRAFIAGQKKNPELEPFVAQALVADNWYRGKNYDSAKRAITDMFTEWLSVPTDAGKILEYHQNVLNRAVTKVNQTL